MPEADFTKELGSRFSKFAKDTWAIEPPNNNNIPDVMRSVAGKTSQQCTSPHTRGGTYKYNPAEEKMLEDEFQHLTLVDNLNMHKVTTNGNGYRFFGKSSGTQLIQTALDLKNSYTGDPSNSRQCPNRPEFWSLPPVRRAFLSLKSYLTLFQWENREGIIDGIFPTYSFPDEDLMNSLVDLYFRNLNIFLPLLHRPTFERSLSEGLHHKDDMFAAVILLVCACASRYSDDDRVLLDGEESRHSSGWKWFDQVQLIRKSLLTPPTLYDLQVYVVRIVIICFAHRTFIFAPVVHRIPGWILCTPGILDHGRSGYPASSRCGCPSTEEGFGIKHRGERTMETRILVRDPPL